MEPSKPEPFNVLLPLGFGALSNAWNQQQAGHLIALSQNSGFGFADSHGGGALSPDRSVIRRTVVDVSCPKNAGSIGTTNHDANLANHSRMSQEDSMSIGDWIAALHAWNACSCTGQ